MFDQNLQGKNIQIQAFTAAELKNCIMEQFLLQADVQNIIFKVNFNNFIYEYWYLNLNTFCKFLCSIFKEIIPVLDENSYFYCLIESKKSEENRIFCKMIFDYRGDTISLDNIEMSREEFEYTIKIENFEKRNLRVTVQFEFDAADEKYEMEDIFSERTMGQNETIFNGEKILIAEDNELNIEILENILKEFGLAVDKTYDGDEVTDIFQQSDPNYYSLIFMDIIMPEMNGIEAAKKIRKMKRADAKEIPIIAMTGNNAAEDRKEAMENGISYHLSKPFDVEEIKRILTLYLK